jgi:hypothetical protein
MAFVFIEQRRQGLEHLGVGLGVEGTSLADEHLAERTKVLDDAVVLQ